MTTAPSASDSNQYDLAWKHAKDFVDADTGICIRVNSALMPDKFPGQEPMYMYSFEVIRAKNAAADRVSRFFPMLMKRRNERVIAEEFPFAVLNHLISEASQWARGQRQEREDRVTQQRIEMERKK